MAGYTINNSLSDIRIKEDDIILTVSVLHIFAASMRNEGQSVEQLCNIKPRILE